tara:strand:+ start:161 stop:436 length:276 start_codon:yes stop_codon:yes gene_type:complete
MKVSNFTSANGNKIANQFLMHHENKIYFQSYESIIVMKEFTESGEITTLDTNRWDYSKTTGKYRNQFLNETKAETQKKIDSGEYQLINLNK